MDRPSCGNTDESARNVQLTFSGEAMSEDGIDAARVVTPGVAASSKKRLTRDILGFATFVWVSVGFLNSAAENWSKAREVWPSINPFFLNVGFTAVYSTVLTLLVATLFVGWRRIRDAILRRSEMVWLKRFLLGFSVFEFFMVLSDESEGYRIEGEIARVVFQVIGIAICVYACFRLYVILRDRGWIPLKLAGS
jgi:hypothetical protein